MSDLESKLEQQRSTEGRAQRTYASLCDARGFMVDHLRSTKEAVVVSICPMDKRSFWRHVGNGRFSARDALYEKVEEP